MKLAGIAPYALTILPPVAFLLLAGQVAGEWAWAALAWLTIICAVADQLLAPPERAARSSDEIYSDALLVIVGIGHLAVLASTTFAIGAGELTTGQSIALFVATASFLGQVSHPAGHELIHRKPRILRWLGAAIYTTGGFGHHVSAHRLVHHRFVGTADDPNTPLDGEGLWHYLPRAWAGSFKAGFEQERQRLSRRSRSAWHFTNPYYCWVGGALITVIAVLALFGPLSALIHLALCGMMGMQILMSDYIQHYGLRRRRLPNGRIEPVAAHHSWNAPRAFSSYLMLNAPSHSEHHIHPDRSYEVLDPKLSAPTLPYSMPIMAVIATMPRRWMRMMDKRAARALARYAKAPRPAVQQDP